MIVEILSYILLFFNYASTISLIPVLIITGNYWYIIIPHIISIVLLSIVCYKKINVIAFSWLNFIIQITGIALVQYFTDVYKIVLWKETNDVFLWIHTIVQIVTIFVLLIYMYKIIKNKPPKVQDLNEIQIS